jgi:hypothetical protein
VGCGDFCLFCGDGGGGSGGGGGQGGTAEAGDVILADQSASSIFIYESSDEELRTLLSGQQDVSGLALYSSEAEVTCDNPFDGLSAYQAGGATVSAIATFDQQDGEPDRLSLAVIPEGMTFLYDTEETDPDQDTTELLFFTVDTDDTLYIYDLTRANVPDGKENPQAITNEDLGTGFFQSPTALAVIVADGIATLFVLNDNGNKSSVKRFSVGLEDWEPDSQSVHTLATMSQDDFRLVDIALMTQGDENALFISKKRIEFVQGFVHKISTPSTTSDTEDLDDADSFVQRDQRITGLTVPSTNQSGTSAELLVLREDVIEGQVEQYDPDVGGTFPEAAFTPSGEFAFLQAIEYDCTNNRLLMTNVPFDDFQDRVFLQAVRNSP